MRRLDWLLVLLCCAAFACTCITAKKGHAQDYDGVQRHIEHHAPFHDFYREWRQPAPSQHLSCCNARYDENGTEVGDCEATHFELKRDQNGQLEWWAQIPEKYGGRMIPVPEGRIRPYKNPDLTGTHGHLCWSPASGVLCAVPPTGVL